VKNGMYLGRAISLCPDLVTIPYDFEAYTEVSYALYNTIVEYTLAVEAVSCDEMFIDCTSALRAANVTPDVFTKAVRDEVSKNTGCPCSAGLGANKLLVSCMSYLLNQIQHKKLLYESTHHFFVQGLNSIFYWKLTKNA